MKQLTLDLRNESYHSIDDLADRQKHIYDTLKKFPNGAISKVIAIRAGLPINCITGRIKELCDKGLVYAAGKVWDASTKRNVTLFKIVEP